MAIEEERVQATVTADTDNFESQLRETLRNINNAGETIQRTNRTVSTSTQQTSRTFLGFFRSILSSYQELSFKMFVWTQMFRGIQKVTGAISNLAQEADNLTMKWKGLNAVAEAFGQDGGVAEDNVKKIVEMTNGMVGLNEATQGYKFLLSVFKDNDIAMQIAENALEVGVYGNVVGDLGQAFVDFSKGTKTASVELMENIGLTQKLSSIMKRANVDISTGIDLVSDKAQQQAFLNYVLEEGARFQGNLADATDGYTASIKRNDLVVDKFLKNLGLKLQPLVKTSSDLTAGLSGFFNKFIQFKPNIEDVNRSLFDMTEKMMDLQTELSGLEEGSEQARIKQKELVDITEKLSKVSKILKGNYDDQTDSIFDNAASVEVLIQSKLKELKISNAQLIIENKSLEKDKEKYDKKYNKEKSYYEKRNKIAITSLKELEIEENLLERNMLGAKQHTYEEIKKLEENKIKLLELKEKIKKSFDVEELSSEARKLEFVIKSQEKKIEMETKQTEKASIEYNKRIEKIKEEKDLLELSIVTSLDKFEKENELLIAQKTLTDNKIDQNNTIIKQNKELGLKTEGVKTVEEFRTIWYSKKKKEEDKVEPETKDKESTIDVKARAESFYQEQERSWKEAAYEYHKNRQAFEEGLITENQFIMSQKETESAKNIWKKAQETSKNISKLENEEKTMQNVNSIKQDFELFKIREEQDYKLSKLIIEAKEKSDEEEQAEIERQQKEKLRVQEKLNSDYEKAQLEFIEEENKIKADEVNAITEYEKSEIEARKKANQDKLALETEYYNKKDAISTEESLKSIEAIKDRALLDIEAELEMTEAKIKAKEENDKVDARVEKERIKNLNEHYNQLKEVENLIEDLKNGKIEAEEIRLDKYERLTRREKEILDKQIQDQKGVDKDALAWKKDVLSQEKMLNNVKAGIVQASNQLMIDLTNGEAVHLEELEKIARETIANKFGNYAQEALGESIWHTALAVGSSAFGNHASATAHYTAAATYATTALTLGGASALFGGMTSPESSGSTGSKDTTTTDTTRGTETTDLEKPQSQEYEVININFEDNMSEFALNVLMKGDELIKKGYKLGYVKKN